MLLIAIAQLIHLNNSRCKTRNYLRYLPTASIVIPTYEERWSTLLRSCYSILKRSPAQLLHEIIIVDDGSTRQFLKSLVDDYVQKHMSDKVKVIHLPERIGLVTARLTGARAATGDVLVFLDSHIEVGYNWLPPLLETIAENPKTCVCPFLDVIDYKNFAISPQEGARGGFDWYFDYKRLDLLPEDLIDRTKPFKSPVMSGGIFAIDSKFFWEIGGYDEGLDVWGGEQYELSFKIWMCGGQIFDVPCSRISHVYRDKSFTGFRNTSNDDYVHRNYKRVAEVWMDEYKQFLYDRAPRDFEIDIGDISKQKALRKRLECKSFKWFMEKVAFDIPKKYPYRDPPDIAHGVIQSDALPHMCLDTYYHDRDEPVGLYPCAEDLVHPQLNQAFTYSVVKEIRVVSRRGNCLDVTSDEKDAPVMIMRCSFSGFNQFWSYEFDKKLLKNNEYQDRCLDTDSENVFLNICDPDNPNMRWNFGFLNSTLLEILADFICKTKNYLTNLPTASVIIPALEEYGSTLLRSCYSILHRSPPELLHEIIIVDDGSKREFMHDLLDDYIKSNFLHIVKVIHLPERMGLMKARLAGAKAATGEVLIFLDSHIEVGYNWLPPLLEPIAENPKTCICPFIDTIHSKNFRIQAQDEGARGAFDWFFDYKRLPLFPEDKIDRTKPFKSPVMAGGLFAIGSKFFWEIGGYDEGLDVWGGEQYELSFKIWMCGGQMFDAPCSRIAHIYRGKPFNGFGPAKKGDYIHRNYKRVAEVWMDEYKQFLYDRAPIAFEIETGDISKQAALRESLQCKSFKWFMDEIAFDLPKKYPYQDPPDIAHGVIRSVAQPNMCIDTGNHGKKQPIGIYTCAKDLVRPHSKQAFSLTAENEIRTSRIHYYCLDASSNGGPVIIYSCHLLGSNQYWSYDIDKKLLMNGDKKNRCLDTDFENVFVNKCDPNNPNMKWNFGFVNFTLINDMKER